MNLNATLIAQTIVFFLLAGFTMKFVWPPLIRALDERAKKIADGLAAAERGTLSLRDAEAKAQHLETEARARGAEILAQAERRALALIDEAKEDYFHQFDQWLKMSEKSKRSDRNCERI